MVDWVAAYDALDDAPGVARFMTFAEAAMEMERSPLQNGHDIMDAIRADLALFDVDGRYRSADQVRMQEFFLAACAKRIYGDAYDLHQLEIMEYNNWSKLDVRVAVSTPRRWGKTKATSMLLAVLVKHVPGLTIGIFSTGERVGGKDDGFLGHILGDLEIISIDKITKNDKEHLFVRCVGGAESKIRAYPKGNASYVFCFEEKNTPKFPHIGIQQKKVTRRCTS